jgi:hypothetical protein
VKYAANKATDEIIPHETDISNVEGQSIFYPHTSLSAQLNTGPHENFCCSSCICAKTSTTSAEERNSQISPTPPDCLFQYGPVRNTCPEPHLQVCAITLRS